MRCKGMCVVVLVVLIVSGMPALARTNIWGSEPNNHQFTVSVGSDSAVVGWMWMPVERFSWGFRVAGVLTEAADRSDSTWDTTMVGIGIEYPLIDFESIFDEVPVNGQGFMAVSLDMDVENDYTVYMPLEAGIDVVFNEHVSFRVVKALTELNSGQTVGVPDIRFGVKVVW